MYPDTRAASASAKNAKKAMLMAEDEESVNIVSDPSLILFVNGTAADAADINRYAIICIFISEMISKCASQS